MEFVLVAFRSRSSAVALYNVLQRNGIDCELVNTPKEAGVGCGLSVKIPKNILDRVRKYINGNNIKSYAGAFTVKTVNGRRIIKSV